MDLARRALPETAEFVAVDLARIKRFIEGETASVADIARDSRQLQDLLQLENGQGVSGPWLAYRALAQGKLDEALQLASASPNVQASISLLVAASDGAAPDVAAKVIRQHKVEGLAPTEALYLLALAIRSGPGAEPYRTELEKSVSENKDLIPALDGLVHGKAALFEDAILRLTPSDRGFAYAAAVIVLGNKAPQQWREYARRLLFPAERPYFTLGWARLSLR